MMEHKIKRKNKHLKLFTTSHNIFIFFLNLGTHDLQSSYNVVFIGIVYYGYLIEFVRSISRIRIISRICCIGRGLRGVYCAFRRLILRYTGFVSYAFEKLVFVVSIGRVAWASIERVCMVISTIIVAVTASIRNNLGDGRVVFEVLVVAAVYVWRRSNLRICAKTGSHYSRSV